MKGQIEERIIHAYSMLAIKIGTIILAIITVLTILLQGVSLTNLFR